MQNILLEVLNKLNSKYEELNSLMHLHDVKIALFGSGQFGRKALKYLRENNYNVICFIDTDIKKQGKEIDGIPVVSLKEASLFKLDVIFITARHAVTQIKKQTAGENIIAFDTWFVIKNINQYKLIRNDLFEDDESKRTLDGILLTMLTGNKKYCAEIMTFNQYFCLPYFSNTGDEFFVDAGAYTGDTLEKFLFEHHGSFKHYYAFEPGPEQFEALEIRKDRLTKEWALDEKNITLIKGGLSERSGTASINITEHLLATTVEFSETSSTNQRIPVYSLDDYFIDFPISFIKADIEGLELPMLKGGAVIIPKNRPKLAISVYHAPDDLFLIVNFIKSMGIHYKFALRHHSPILVDTVLYCWIDN